MGRRTAGVPGVGGRPREGAGAAHRSTARRKLCLRTAAGRHARRLDARRVAGSPHRRGDAAGPRANDARGREAQGLGYLVTGNAAEAIAALEAAAAKDQGRAEIDANLAAAYLAQADLTAGRQDLSKALDAADRALRRNPALPAALFNRALALERLGDPRAATAWQAALEAESDPMWRDEIAKRIRPSDRVPSARPRRFRR